MRSQGAHQGIQYWDYEEPYGSIYRDSTASLRNEVQFDLVMTPKNPPRILVVDDDPTFGKLMERAASVKGIDMTYCKSVDDFNTLQSLNFDAVVMDYDMGEAMNGFDLTKQLEKKLTKEIPVILVSQTERQDAKKWPQAIREFVHKKLGPAAILDATFEAHEISCIHREMEQRRAARNARPKFRKRWSILRS